MTSLVALDVAILPPSDVARRAIALSAALPREEPDGPRLDADHLPHVTLAQLFVREEELDTAFGRMDEVLQAQPPLRLRIAGAGQSSHTIWMTIERTPELVALHERIMDALRGVEREAGGPAAFVDGDARVRDVLWVAGYRLKSSLEQFAPHITLGHAEQPPALEPFAFDASTVAACHLGRFCTCRRVLRRWTLAPAPR